MSRADLSLGGTSARRTRATRLQSVRALRYRHPTLRRKHRVLLPVLAAVDRRMEVKIGMAGGPTSRHKGTEPAQRSGGSLVCFSIHRCRADQGAVRERCTGIRGALDLSELELDEVPPKIFDLAGLKVLSAPSLLQRLAAQHDRRQQYCVLAAGAHACW